MKETKSVTVTVIHKIYSHFLSRMMKFYTSTAVQQAASKTRGECGHGELSVARNDVRVEMHLPLDSEMYFLSTAVYNLFPPEIGRV